MASKATSREASSHPLQQSPKRLKKACLPQLYKSIVSVDYGDVGGLFKETKE